MDQDTKALLRAADAAYYAGTPIMSDADYDAIRRAANIPPSIGPLEPIDTHNTPRATFPMLSLEKADTASLPTFLGSIGAHHLIIEPKIDGISIELNYTNRHLSSAITRGNGAGGIDITHLLQQTTHATISTPEPLSVHAELYVTDAAARAMHNPTQYFLYASPRAAVTAIINQINPITTDLRLAVHDVLPLAAETDLCQAYTRAEAAGLPLLPHIITTARGITHLLLRQSLTAFLAEFPCDGLVLKTTNYRLRKQLGSTATAPRHTIAIKDYTIANLHI